MPKDIFPYIDIPVVSVIWTYNGISPDEMASRITTVFERGLTSTVNDIEHIESSSYNGVSVIRIFFQPNVKIDLAIAQVVAVCQPIQRILPPGIFPPGVIKYDASSVPILQLSLSSKTLSEQELYDLGANFIRTQLATIQGATIPPPLWRQAAQIMVDLDPERMYAQGLSATDISNALNAQNLILPSGTAKMGDREYFIRLNSSPTTMQGVNDLPVKTSQWRRRLHARCRAGARRLRGAKQHRPRERPPLGAHDRHQERPGVHPGYRQRHQSARCRK